MSPNHPRPMTLARTSWVFTPLEDLLVMLGVPLALGLALLGVFAVTGADIYDDNDSVSFFVFVLGDHTHLYVSLAISAGFSDEFRRRRVFYLVTPLAIFAVLASINAWSRTAFFQVFAVYSIYHFIKQELGWMMVSSRKGGTTNALELRVDKLALYSVTALPALFYLAASDAPGWFITGDFPDLPFALAPWLFFTWAAAVFAYPLWFFAKNRGRDVVSWGKLFVWGKNVIVWGMTFVFWYQNILWGIAVLTVSHAAPYIYLGFKYGRRKLERLQPNRPAADVLRLIKLVYLGAVLLAFAHYLVEVYPEYFLPARAFGVPLQVLAHRYLLLPAFASLTVFHFVIDSFFWKRKNNPDAVF